MLVVKMLQIANTVIPNLVRQLAQLCGFQFGAGASLGLSRLSPQMQALQAVMHEMACRCTQASQSRAKKQTTTLMIIVVVLRLQKQPWCRYHTNAAAAPGSFAQIALSQLHVAAQLVDSLFWRFMIYAMSR